MARLRSVLVLILVSTTILLAQPGSQPSTDAPITNLPKVQLKGRVHSVQLAAGQGTASVVVSSGPSNIRVLLGSVRYLIERGFNPKAGDEIVVEGYRAAEDVIASQVTLVAEGKTLKLRDERGRPLWTGARRGRAQQDPAPPRAPRSSE